MNELDRLSDYILRNCVMIASYTAIDSDTRPIHAFEVDFDDNILLVILDGNNHCTGIIRK